MLPTVRQVLAMPALAHAAPEVLAGSQHLDRPVRWLHPAEVVDIADLLRGDELVLTTGMILPEESSAVVEYVSSLTHAGAAGLIVELGRKWSQVPDQLVEASRRGDLVLIALHREVSFAVVVEEVGARILDAQVEDLRVSEHIHETFTHLDLEAATADEILEAVVQLSGCPVVLESTRHRVIAYRTAAKEPRDIIGDWLRRSRAVALPGRTGYDRRTGWLMTLVGSRGDDWGRLILMTTALPSRRDYVLVERAAAALTLFQMHARARDSAERNTHYLIVSELRRGPASAELRMRCEAVNFPTTAHSFFAVAIRTKLTESDPRHRTMTELSSTLTAATRTLGYQALCAIDTDHVISLIGLPKKNNPETAMAKLAAVVHRTMNVVIARGEVVDSIDDVSRTLISAEHVLAATDDSDTRAWVTLEDTHLRGLIHLLRDDERLRLFTQRELAPLLAHDATRGTDLVELLTVVLTNPGGKTAAAKKLLLSRPVLYERLDRIQTILGVDLEDPHIRASLYLAVVARSLIGS